MANERIHKRLYWNFFKLWNTYETKNYVKGLDNQLS